MSPRYAVLLILPLFINLTACSKPASTPPVPTVGVEKPTHRDINVERDFIGEVAALEEAEIRSKVNGRVLSVEFKEGSLVTAGQPLFRIDSDSLQATVSDAKAGVSRAKADLTNATRDEERYRVLVKKGSISAQEYDAALNRLAQTKAAVESAQAELEQSETMLRESAIVSPYSGRIGRAQVKEGSLVAANQTLLATVSTTTQVQVNFAISERDYLAYVRPRLESGQQRSGKPVKLILADGAEYSEPGYITFSDRGLSSTTGTFAVAATFPNPQELLRPGMFGRVRILVEQLPNALVIPTRALQEVLDKTFVSVVNAEGKVERKAVEVGPRSGTFVNIRTGIEDNDLVIVDGFHKAPPGSKVNVQPVTETDADTPPPQA